MKCNYRENKSDAVYINHDPSLADQAGADENNVNVIVRKYAVTGTMPGHQKEPITDDLSLMPSDLRTMIELTREIGHLRRSLPRELRDRPQEELDSLTTNQLMEILTPPAKTPDTTEEPK